MTTVLSYKASVILSTIRGLLGAVSCKLRSVFVECRTDALTLYCYFDGEISDDDKASMSEVRAAVALDFPDHTVIDHCIRIDAPERIAFVEGRHIAFKRKEREED